MSTALGQLLRRAKSAGCALLGAIIFWAPSPASALGILVPRETQFSGIRLADSDIKVEIKQNIAKTRIVQEFFNPNSRQLEADFFFPVPKGANVTDFVLYMNGKPVKGEVLEKEKAREIYEGIVRRMQDPGLLEWADYNLFKVRVFPVPANGTQKIELEFAQPLEADQGTFKYTFPLKTPRGATAGSAERSPSDPKVDFTVAITSDEPLRNVYSPSHSVDVDNADPKAAKVKLTQKTLKAGSGDFVLFYEPSKKDLAVSVIGQRTSSSEDGFFSLMISPPIKGDASQVAPQDVTFVIDTSGSMLDEKKIEQARRALTYCVSQLQSKDRFALVRFSTETEKFKEGLVDASKENIDAAKNWISQLEARGGTNISDALKDALALRPKSDEKSASKGDSGTSASASADRIYTIVFITDGVPTVGQTQPNRIVELIKDDAKQNGGSKRSGSESSGNENIRIFTFGVGNDVNAKLLDRLADETRAAAEYVRPGQDMEAPISRFFDKISRPAMTGLKLELTTSDAFDMYPKELPDLFYGSQLTVFGRYKKPGQTAIRLTGQVAGKPADFTFEKALPEKEAGNEFVEKLWGTRKIAYLLDSIRRNGENSETKDEVIKLAKKYGVVTPYTSYLVADDQEYPAEVGRQRRVSAVPPPMSSPIGAGDARGGRSNQYFATTQRSESRGDISRDRNGAPVPAAAAPGMPGTFGMSGGTDMAAESGAGAVRASSALRAMKEAKSSEDLASSYDAAKNASGRNFQLVGGTWVDTAITDAAQSPQLKIKYLSAAYFEALRLQPELREAFALGDKVRIQLKEGILEIAPEGKEDLTDPDREFLKKL